MAIPEHVKYLAEQLLPQFLPKNDQQTTLTFQFTMVPAITYRVTFDKKTAGGKNVWQLIACEEVKEN